MTSRYPNGLRNIVGVRSMTCRPIPARLKKPEATDVAFLCGEDIPAQEKSIPAHVIVEKDGKEIILEPRVMPCWMAHDGPGIVRVHQEVLDRLGIQPGDEVNVIFIGKLPPLDHLDVSFDACPIHDSPVLRDGLRRYLLGRPVVEGAPLKLHLGFADVGMKMKKTYPFHRGVVHDKTRIKVS